MENRTLRDWKLYRQLRKTLDTICSDHEADQTWLMSSTSYSPNKSFDDILEITSIEDEGNRSLFRNKRFVLDKKLKRNSSKFAILLEYRN